MLSGDAPSAPDRPLGFVDRRGRAEFFRMGAATFLTYLMHAHATMLAVALQARGLGLHDIGVLLSFFGVPVVLLTIVSGPLMARFGALAAARAGMVLMMVGFASLAFTASSFWLALVSRTIQGAGYGLVLAPVMTYAQGRLTQERFIYLLGIFSTMAPLAQAFGPGWAEFLFHRFGDRVLFLGAAVPAFAGLLLTLGLRPLLPSGRRGIGSLASGLRRDLVLPLVTIFVSGSMFSFLATYMAPTLVEKGVGLAWFFTPSTAAMFASRFLAFRYVEAIDRRLVVAGGLALMASALFIVAQSSSHAAVIAGGVTFGFGYSVVYPLVSAWMSAGFEPSERSGPQAVFNAVFAVGLMGMPFPITYVIAGAGYGVALVVLASMGWAMAAVLVLHRATRRPL